MSGPRLVSPAAERNLPPILAALGPVLAGRSGTVLEIGSGPGQHAAALAAAFPNLVWQPSDPDPAACASSAAWAEDAGLANLRPPLLLDARAPWPVAAPLAAVLAINVIHIAAWAVAEAILAGAARHLGPGGVLLLYGPFAEGAATGPGNRRFDAVLRAQNPDWGLRALDAVAAAAARAGLGAPAVTAMPADNRLLVFPRA